MRRSTLIALLVAGCSAGPSDPESNDPITIDAGVVDAGAPDAGTAAKMSACPTGLPKGGECNLVTREGCRDGESCAVGDGPRSFCVDWGGTGRHGDRCADDGECRPGLNCINDLCVERCCGEGDDATCDAAEAGWRCEGSFTNVPEMRFCTAPPPPPECPSEYTLCPGDKCFQLERDTDNCGACGHACADGEACLDGVCCGQDVGTRACGGACVNVRTDPLNCGSCGHTCQPGELCAAERCTSSGTSCGSDADCHGVGGGFMICVPESLGFQDGMCGYFGIGSDCGYDSDCRDGYRCGLVGGSHSCVPRCDLAPELLCGEKKCFADVNVCGVPGTTGGCYVDSECSPGSTCTGPERTNLTRTCQCTARTDCGPGRGCFAHSTKGMVCGCSSDAVCGPGHHCNADHECAFTAL